MVRKDTYLSAMMEFSEAYERYIKGQPIADCGYMLTERIKQPNGFFTEIGGYYVKCENGYMAVFSGASLGGTAIQEAMIVDPAKIMIARDTEDMRYADGHDPYAK